MLFDDDIKESVMATNVQKCDFSLSWTLSLQNFPGEHAPEPTKRPEKFFPRRCMAPKIF